MTVVRHAVPLGPRCLVHALALSAAVACGDNVPAIGGDLDASATGGDPDASATAAPDGASDSGAEPAVVVFDNQDGAFVWGYRCRYGGPYEGRYLDLIRAAGDQEEAPPGRSSIYFCRHPPVELSTRGGFWFNSFYDPDAPGTGASFAVGEPFVIEGSVDDTDLLVTPPAVKEIGGVVGPDDEWLSGEEASEWVHQGPQEAHFQDNAGDYGPDAIWFMSGIIGVRFNADDGVHYGFVELDWLPSPLPQAPWRAYYLPLRWGYHTAPDTPLVIPR